MNITPQQAHTILTGMTDVVMKNHDLENAEIEEISHFALAYILAEVESLATSHEQVYAYDVPTEDGTELAYAIYFTKYHNPLPEGSIPLYASQPESQLPDISALKRIAKELKTYIPEADEYKGKFIHKVWAREIESALLPSSNGVDK